MKNCLKIAGAALFICTTFAGCNGSNPSSSTDNPSPKDEVAQPLEGLSAKDLIKTKYQSAVLECQLDFTIRETEENVTSTTPYESTATWDLLADYAETKELKLTAKGQGNSVTADIDIQKIDIQNANVLFENGQEHSFKNSPVIFSNTKVHSDGTIIISDQVSSEFGASEMARNRSKKGFSKPFTILLRGRSLIQKIQSLLLIKVKTGTRFKSLACSKPRQKPPIRKIED